MGPERVVQIPAEHYGFLFGASPTPYLVIDPDLTIVAVNGAYLRATMTTEDQLLGRSIFDAFPNNPDDPHATGVGNLRASIQRAVAARSPDIMAIQKYDIRRPDQRGGGFEERYWSPINTPVYSADGSLLYILHRVEDVTDFLTTRRDFSPPQGGTELRLELFKRAQEIQLRNRELQREYERQQSIASLARAALSGASIKALMDQAASIVRSGTNSDFTRVMENLPNDEGLIVRAGVGWGPEVVGREIVEGGPGSQSGYTMDTGEPVVVEDIANEKRFRVAPMLRRYGVQSTATVVIPGIIRPFGILSTSSREKRRFNASEIQFLQVTANVLGTAFELAWSREAQRLVLQRQITAQEDERRRIAREIHDESGQLLTALILGLAVLEQSPDIEQARTQARQLHFMASAALGDLGRMARGLHPAILDEQGLAPALESYIADYSASCAVEVQFKADGWREPTVDRDREMALYRIAQEALTNVVRHSRSRTARVTLASLDGSAHLTVEDDGKGFRADVALNPVSPERKRLGLLGMRERAALYGGWLRIESKIGGGTKLMAQIPLR